MDKQNIDEISPFQEDVFNLDKVAEEDLDARKLQIKTVCADYQEVFGTPAGQRVLWDLFEQTGLFSPFEQYNATAYAMIAKRQIGLYILAANGFSPDPLSLAKLIKSLMGAKGMSNTEVNI